MNGILCIDKPQGFTSFDVIAKLRGILRMKRLGHSGTLDPMATGVLPIFVGGATKACGILPDDHKGYLAQFQLGVETDTQDSTGNILCEGTYANITQEQIEEKLLGFCGEIAQIPPMYSAVSVGGKRLYQLAREGKTIEVEPRMVRVDSITLRAYDSSTGQGSIDIRCRTGVYVRTILHDLGQELGCGAMMTQLRRTLSNGFALDRCVTLEELQRIREDDGDVTACIQPIAEVFSQLPKIQLDAKLTRLYKNGVKLATAQLGGQIVGAERYAVYGVDGFLGTAYNKDDVLRVERNLNLG